MNKIFLVETIIITFIYLLALFIVQNFKKFLQQIQSYEDAPFLGPKWSICPNYFFFLENYQYLSHLPISAFHWAKLKKKNFQQIQSYEDAQFLGLKWFISPTENFFSENLLMSLVSFIHAYLHAKNQSQILIYQ